MEEEKFPVEKGERGVLCHLLVLARRVNLSVSGSFEDLAEKEDFEERGKKASFLQAPCPNPLEHGLLLKIITCPHVG